MSEEQNPIRTNNIKGALSLSLSFITQTKNDKIDLTSNQLIVITAAGTIYGTPLTKFPDEKDMGDIALSTAYDQARNISGLNTDNCLILKDATIISSPTFKQSFKTLFVFLEDIIAVTLGDTTIYND